MRSGVRPDLVEWLSGEPGFAVDPVNAWLRALERFFAARRRRDAQDCAQQTMLRVIELFGRGEHLNYPSPGRLIFGIAKNELLKAGRGDGVQARAASHLLEAVVGRERDQRLAYLEPPWRTTQERCLESAYEQLSPGDRLIADRYWLGVAEEHGANKSARKQLAEDLNVDPHRLTVRANRLLSRLRQQMDYCIESHAGRATEPKRRDISQ